MKKLFSGEQDSIKTLADLVSDGKLIDGKSGIPNWDPGNHTDNWLREKNIERAFYAANRPAPVVVDFGPSCEIDARKYFFEGPESYN